MMQWLFLNAGLSALACAAYFMLRSAPARVRMWPLFVALLSWCLPIHLLTFETEAAAPMSLIVSASGPAAAAPGAASQNETSYWLYLFAAALFIGLLRFGRDLMTNRRTRLKMLAESYPAPQLAQILPKSLHRSVPAIRVWPNRSGAAVSGLFKPCVWIGEVHLDTPELTGVLCHEVVHASRGDNLILSVTTLAERLFWWNPVAWLLAARIRLELERSCDERCSSLLTPKRYQADLAALLLADHGFLPSGRMAAALGGSARSNILRIQSLERRSQMKIRHVLSLALFTLTSLSLFATTASEVHKIGEVDQPPLFTKRVAPTYPEKARNDKVQDYVILEATLGKDGSISDIKTLRSGKKGYDLDKAAAEALGKWEFRPGEKGDQPVDVRMTLKIDFVLQPEDDKKEDAGDDN